MADAMVGTMLANRYKIGRKIGQGETGSVYAALDPQERRKVAIKVLHPQLCTAPEQVLRFEREAAATAEIDHPNVVRSWGMIREGPRCFMVMEILDGKLLSSEIKKRRKLTLERSLNLAHWIAQGLEQAHKRGVIHRDLNPNNVMLLKGGGLKVMDFGLARLTGSNEDITAVGVRLGSARYMAPEYIQDTHVDHLSDLYALGIVLHEMLTGAPPFIGPSLKVMDDHVRTPPQPPSATAPGIPPFVDELVLSLLAKNPEDRPLSAAILAEELNRVIDLVTGDDRWSTAESTGDFERPSSVPQGLGATGSFPVPTRADREAERAAEAAAAKEPIATRSRGLQIMVIVTAVVASVLTSALAGALLFSYLNPR